MSITRTNWLEWKTMSQVDFRRGIVMLPAFTYVNPTWQGAGEIVTQYNYSADRNFRLTSSLAKPVGVNYGLCIRFRVGETVHRYRLWDFDLNASENPLYTNQIIGKNFVIEIWTLVGESTSSQATAITLFTSLRKKPDDYRDLSVYAIADGAEVLFAELQGNLGTLTVPTTGLQYDWNADSLAVGAVASWVDSINNANLIQVTANQRPVCAVGLGFSGHKYVLADGVNDSLAVDFGIIVGIDLMVFLVIQQTTWADNKSIFSVADVAGPGAFVALRQKGLTPELVVIDDVALESNPNPDATLGATVIARFRVGSTTTPSGIQINDGDEQTMVSNVSNWQQLATGAANVKIARMLVYEAAQVDYAVDSNIKRYLEQHYGLSIGPVEDVLTTYSANSAWLDNVI